MGGRFLPCASMFKIYGQCGVIQIVCPPFCLCWCTYINYKGTFRTAVGQESKGKTFTTLWHDEFQKRKKKKKERVALSLEEIKRLLFNQSSVERDVHNGSLDCWQTQWTQGKKKCDDVPQPDNYTTTSNNQAITWDMLTMIHWAWPKTLTAAERPLSTSPHDFYLCPKLTNTTNKLMTRKSW